MFQSGINNALSAQNSSPQKSENIENHCDTLLRIMSETSSLKSSSTLSSSRYRTISRSSSIDESLFGENRRPNRCIVKHKHNEIGLNCMRKADIDGILRRNSPGKKIVKEKISGNVEQKARARKDHMLRLEMEQSNKAKSSVTRKKKSVKKELNLGNEQSEDIVKLLNTCKQRTAAFAIRDQQLKDKAIREKEERDYERLMDLEMEVNRLKDIAAREKMEEAKIKKRIADRKVIEDQIKERQHLRLLQEEARDQENRKMLETIKKYEEEDAEKTRKRKEDVRKSKVEILRRNEEILAEREAKKAFEKKEEETIMAYLAERDEILRKREEEEAEAQIKKIELQKKLLEKQTKVLDKRSEEDEIRARRAAEENERKHRLRELKEAQKRKKDSEMLLQSRKLQEEERLIAKEREKQEKQDEYNNTLKQAAEMAKRERDEAAYKKTKNAELRMMLQQQIEENESKRKIQEREKYKEGKEIKDKMEAEREKLENIRAAMVSDMRSKGLNEKYFGEMLTLDIEKILMQ